MPSTRSGASYNPSSSSQKGNRRDYGRSQPGTEGKGSVDDFQTTKIGNSDADNTILPSQRADTATRSLSGHIQSQPQSLQQCPAVQGVPDPCRSVEKLHEFLPDSPGRILHQLLAIDFTLHHGQYKILLQLH
ncbi:hypothetical protein O181_131567 [Austropuccinia psidii MF-1]|uniref:Uncharacterized protein n=1 Tax=Austropuccinia psidii MF-1 TaxID=1389203 RepID=A0A9Q3L3B5_9BASI|nr:hypothetical protein [Austropuccinia psidii MF-1]